MPPSSSSSGSPRVVSTAETDLSEVTTGGNLRYPRQMATDRAVDVAAHDCMSSLRDNNTRVLFACRCYVGHMSGSITNVLLILAAEYYFQLGSIDLNSLIFSDRRCFPLCEVFVSLRCHMVDQYYTSVQLRKLPTTRAEQCVK